MYKLGLIAQSGNGVHQTLSAAEIDLFRKSGVSVRLGGYHRRHMHHVLRVLHQFCAHRFVRHIAEHEFYFVAVLLFKLVRSLFAAYLTQAVYLAYVFIPAQKVEGRSAHIARCARQCDVYAHSMPPYIFSTRLITR